MAEKIAVMVYLGDYYGSYTDFPSLHFAYKNVYELTSKLRGDGWIVYPPIGNEAATKEYCLQYLKEKIGSLQNEDDWLLFYFVGHADQYITADVYDTYPVYMVTSTVDTGDDPNDPISYFMDTCYGDIIQLFHQKASNGHLITILDCCYAFGLINQMYEESSFHTVFAAANGNAKAAYTDNSFFFKSLEKSWNGQSFEQIKAAVIRSMREDYAGYVYVNLCKIQLAENFKQATF